MTSSSANVESYFKDVKHTLKNLIPARADVFLQHHLDGINDLIITASQKYAKLIDLNVDKTSKSSTDTADKLDPVTYDDDSDFDARQLFNRSPSVDEEEEEDRNRKSNEEREELIEDGNRFTNCSSDEEDRNSKSNTETNTQKDIEAIESTNTCIACKEGNFPTGAHTCIKCNKNVHILPGCSFSIGSEEGYGTKRICISCHSIEQKSTQSQEAKAMNMVEKWGPKKTGKNKVTT